MKCEKVVHTISQVANPRTP